MNHRPAYLYMTLLLCASLASCGGEAPPEPAADAPAAANGSPAMRRSEAPAAARVFFVAPEDGATVSNPVRVEFGLEGMELSPAGQERPHAGHHHVLVDTPLPELGLPVPVDDRHVHFGAGQTETELTLSPGEHTLQLLFADHLHVPHDPPVYSDVITITVE